MPAALIAPQVTAPINELAGRLGYVPVDAGWGTPGSPADPRVPDTIRTPAPPPGPQRAGAAVPGSRALLEFLRARVEAAGERFASRWGPTAAEKFLVVSRVVASGSEAEAQWVVDLAARTVTAEDDQAGVAGDGQADEADDVRWSMLGSPEAWEAVLAGQANLQAALRHNDLRYCPASEEEPQDSQERVVMLTDLLGLVSWNQPDSAGFRTAKAAPAPIS